MFKKREKKAKTIDVEDKGDEGLHKNITDTDFKEKDSSYLTNNKVKTMLKKKRASHFSTSTVGNTEENTKSSLIDELRYKSNYTLKDSNDATREIEIDTERDKDATAILKRKMQISKDKLEGKIKEDQYMGRDSTIIYAQKSERDMTRYKVTGTMGPMRAPTNVRTTCRFDYAYGICKDFKETGYCGFGDSCVFMHDRSDYKTGWEMEEEWKKEQLNKQKLIREGKYKEDADSCHSEDEEDTSTSNPLKCPICDSDFISPVSTKCSHYFCEKCALAHYAKSSLCYVCRKPTQGIFNNAEKVISEIEKRRRKKELRRHNDHSQNKPETSSDDVYTQSIHDKSDEMEYLDRNNRDLIDEEDDEYGFKNYKQDKKEKKKNKFKIQNDWQYVSDYKSYI